jgi:hypothetical protein
LPRIALLAISVIEMHFFAASVIDSTPSTQTPAGRNTTLSGKPFIGTSPSTGEPWSEYLLTTDSDFDRATPAKGPAAQTVQISVQQGAEGGGNEPQTPRGNCGIS